MLKWCRRAFNAKYYIVSGFFDSDSSTLCCGRYCERLVLNTFNMSLVGFVGWHRGGDSCLKNSNGTDKKNSFGYSLRDMVLKEVIKQGLVGLVELLRNLFDL